MSKHYVFKLCDINELGVSDEKSTFISMKHRRILEISRTIIDSDNIKLTISEANLFAEPDLDKYEAIVPRIIRIGSELMYHYYYTMDVLRGAWCLPFVKTDETIKLICKTSHNIHDVDILIVFKRVD